MIMTSRNGDDKFQLVQLSNKQVGCSFSYGVIPGNAEWGRSRDNFYDNFLRFLDHFISIFSKKNGYDKFQLLK